MRTAATSSEVSTVQRRFTQPIEVSQPGPPVPRVRLTGREWWAVTVRGVLDRWCARGVADDQYPPFLHQLAAGVRGVQAEQMKWADATRIRIEIEIAAVETVLSTPPVSMPTSGPVLDPSRAAGRERHLWAEQERTRDADAAAARAEVAARTAASLRQMTFKAERAELARYEEDLAEGCRAFFEVRAARYNRARTGLFGRKLGADPRIPPYRGPARQSGTADLPQQHLTSLNPL